MPNALIPFSLPTMLPGMPDGAAPLDRSAPFVEYDLFVRNSSLQVIGQVGDWQKATIIKRFNNIGQCTLLLNASDPMAPFLATPGYGLIIARRVLNAAGVVLFNDPSFFSGPVREFKRENKNGQKSLQVVAYDDLVWIAQRDAWPVYIFPYDTIILSNNSTANPQGYYKFNETSGTVANDSSGRGHNGTYHGTFTLQQAGGLDDPGTAVSLDGSTGYVDTNVTGLVDGFTFLEAHGWFNVTTMPTSLQHPRLANSSHTDVDKNGFQIFLNSDGSLTAHVGNGTTVAQVLTSTGLVTAGKWYHVGLIYDGANIGIWFNGAFQNSAALTGTTGIPSFTTQLGRGVYNGDYFNGKLQDWAFFADNFQTVSQQGRLVAYVGNGSQDVYNVGLSRFAYQATDAQIGQDTETLLQHFVSVNAGPGAITERRTTGLTLATNNHNGSTQSAAATFDDMVAKDGTGLLQRIALASSPVLGFKVTQSGTSLIFSVYVPNNNAASVIFSDDLGNLGDFSYEVKSPDWETGGNYLVVGGAGTGVGRTFFLTSDTNSITAWGRVEQFMDQSNTTDLTTLANNAAGMILKLKDQSQLTLQLLPQGNMTLGINYNLGDKVTYVIDGAANVDIIREVQVDLDSASGEVITPAVGSPNTAALMTTFAHYIQQTQVQIAILRRRLADHERRQLQ